MKLLLDENLSVRLPDRLAEQGIYAEHVIHRGLQGQPDQRIWQYANDNDLIVATINVRDFLKLAKDTDIHTGVIAIRESGLDAAQQEARICSAIDEIRVKQDGRLLNQVLEVQNSTTIVWLDIPPSY